MANITQYDNPLLNSAIQKSWKRLVPLMFIMYFVAFIDRVNVGFAGNDSNLLIVFYVQIMPDDFVMQLHR
ncbi:hypothetical protein MZF39_02865, partial [Escherichia coli]|nr:hypothetical protein [Escherichia coli]